MTAPGSKGMPALFAAAQFLPCADWPVQIARLARLEVKESDLSYNLTVKENACVAVEAHVPFCALSPWFSLPLHSKCHAAIFCGNRVRSP